MAENHDEICDLGSLLDSLEGAGDGEDEVSIGAVHESVGRRSFGPALLIPGLIGASPLSGIPGTPSAVGIMTVLIGGQLLIGRQEFWLPDFVLRRSVSRKRFQKAIGAMRPVARFVDKLIKPRLSWLVNGPALYVIAAVCVALALTAPLLEALPFAITGVGGALTAFGLALVADDGLLAIIALLFCIGTSIGIAMMLT